MERVCIPLQNTFYRLALDRGFKSDNAAITKAAKPANASKTFILQTILLRVAYIRQHRWNITFRNANAVVKEDYLPFVRLYRYLNLAFIFLEDSGLNSRINCICCILHILTIQEQGIVIHPLGQRLNDVLTENWLVTFKHYHSLLILTILVQTLHNLCLQSVIIRQT